MPRDHPSFMPGINTIGLTYKLVNDPDLASFLTTTSHLSGEKINRFNHICQTNEDLLIKQKITRILCHKAGRCIQRCMGIDVMSALSIVTKETDLELGTNYHERF